MFQTAVISANMQVSGVETEKENWEEVGAASFLESKR